MERYVNVSGKAKSWLLWASKEYLLTRNIDNIERVQKRVTKDTYKSKYIKPNLPIGFDVLEYEETERSFNRDVFGVLAKRSLVFFFKFHDYLID